MIIITPHPNSLLHGFQNEQNSPRPQSRLLGLKRELVSRPFLPSLFSPCQGALTLKCVRTAGWEGTGPVQRRSSDQADTASGSELCCWPGRAPGCRLYPTMSLLVGPRAQGRGRQGALIGRLLRACSRPVPSFPALESKSSRFWCFLENLFALL